MQTTYNTFTIYYDEISTLSRHATMSHTDHIQADDTLFEIGILLYILDVV